MRTLERGTRVERAASRQPVSSSPLTQGRFALWESPVTRDQHVTAARWWPINIITKC